MRILRSADYRRMPWKNGGGETREIAAWPLDATLDAIDWCISLASVMRDGSFSLFPGITRTLCVIRGAGVRLELKGGPVHTLTTTTEPFTFDGGVPASASLMTGPIVDLNVMSRRGHFHHRVARLAISTPQELLLDAAIMAIVCGSGVVQCRLSGTAESCEVLNPEDTAIFEGAAAQTQTVRIEPRERGEAYLITLHRHG